jgi:purine-binding chemotaxis protein CheW
LVALIISSDIKNMHQEGSSQPTFSTLAGKHLTFVLGHECYGIPVLKVREIIRICDITPVPQMPPYIRGVLNLRGKIIPVADLRIKFRLANIQQTKHTCIVVVQVVLADHSSTPIGLIVDAVEEVLWISESDIEPAPDFGTILSTDYILGMAKVKGSVKTLLDIDKVVSAVHAETSIVNASFGSRHG